MVARARWSALFAAATLTSSREALSAADHPSTSRRINTARCLGGSSWIAAMNASSIVSRATTSASGSSSLGAIPSSRWSGYGCSHGNSASGWTPSRGSSFRRRRPSASRQAFVAMRYSQARNVERPWKLLRFRHARRNVSWTRVLGVLQRAEHAVAVRLELGAVGLGQRRERRLVARARGRDRSPGLGLRAGQSALPATTHRDLRRRIGWKLIGLTRPRPARFPQPGPPRPPSRAGAAARRCRRQRPRTARRRGRRRGSRR